MNAPDLVAQCARAGVTLFLRTDGTVGFRSDRPVPAELLAEARRGRAAITAVLPAMLADPACPCPVCGGRQFWRDGSASGPPGPWLCAGCSPPAPGSRPDATVLPPMPLAEVLSGPLAAPAPLPPYPAALEGGPPEAPAETVKDCFADAYADFVTAFHGPQPLRPPTFRPAPQTSHAQAVLKIREIFADVVSAWWEVPSGPCPLCGLRQWWRLRGDAEGGGPWQCRSCEPPSEDLDLSSPQGLSA